MTILSGSMSTRRARQPCARPAAGARRRAPACRAAPPRVDVRAPRYVEALVEVPASEFAALGSGAAASNEVADWGHDLLGVNATWRHTQGKGVKVAVLDTGIDLQHPDLAENIVAARDFTGGGTAQDRQGHGTHCAGIVAAVDNDIGVIGVAPKAGLLVGKVLGDDGSGSYDWITAGINWAVDSGADIISMSLGGPYPEPRMKQAIDRAIAAGVVVVAAAGNDGSSVASNIGYPGNYADVICVGSIDRNGRRSAFSSNGKNIDIMAPGGMIRSTWIPPKAYETISGTSMATPFVSGVCALALAKNRASGGARLNQQAMFELLRDNATNLDDPGFDRRTGWGLVDVGFIDKLSLGAPDAAPAVVRPARAKTNGNGKHLATQFARHAAGDE